MGFLNYIILGLYVAGMVAIALYSRKRNKTVNDFLLASKGMGAWMSAFAYGTTYFSAVIFVGYAGRFGWSMGLATTWIGIGNAILGSLLAWKVLARPTKRITNRLGVKTMPEFFESRYESKNVKLFAGILIFVFLIPYSASVYTGLSLLFWQVFGIKEWVCIVVLAALTALYLFLGGYFATALSDFIQGIIMLVGVVVMFIFIMNYDAVSWGDGFSTLLNNKLGFWPQNGEGGWFYGNWVRLISLIGLTSFGVWAMPQVIHKYYAIKDDKAIKKGMLISTGFALIIGVLAYMSGAFGRFFYEGGINAAIPEGGLDTVMPHVLVTALVPGLLGLIAVLLLSASMSTLSSVALCGSSALAVDVYKGYVDKKASDKKVNWTLRISCIMFVVVSAILAIWPIDAIVTMMGLSWGVLAGCFMGPYVLGVLSKKVTKTAMWTSMISGVVLTAILVVIVGAFAPENPSTFGGIISAGIKMSPTIGCIAMLWSIIITPIISCFTKKPSDEILNKCFAADEAKEEETPKAAEAE